MRFDITDPNQKRHAVYLDGELQPNAISANDETGWVQLEFENANPFLGKQKEYQTKYGKVHIVRMDGYVQNDYRAPHLLRSTTPESVD